MNPGTPGQNLVHGQLVDSVKRNKFAKSTQIRGLARVQDGGRVEGTTHKTCTFGRYLCHLRRYKVVALEMGFKPLLLLPRDNSSAWRWRGKETERFQCSQPLQVA
jgi:hypothetical protein